MFAWIALPVVLVVQGCASGYSQFYQPAQNASPGAVAAMRVSQPPNTPQLERSAPEDPQRLLDAYAKRGFALIGSSTFNSGRPESEDAAIRQAQEVGADLVVILNPRYTGSVTSNLPITTPMTSTSNTSSSATAYGPAGSVSARGNSTTTTYGSTTTYIPVTTNRMDYGAMFFVKQKFGLGIFPRDLNESERQTYQTNRGVVVRLVVDNTPAYNNDVLVGDLLTSIDGIPISNSQKLGELLAERRGKRVILSISRKGITIEKAIGLN